MTDLDWVAPVYDRTLADITYRTTKAFFNVADWQRVYGNSLIIHTLANLIYGYNPQFITPTTPAITTFPTAYQTSLLPRNIELLRQALGFPISAVVSVYSTWYLEGLAGTAPDYEDVNNWELDTYLIRKFLRDSVNWITGCGVGGCGQQRYWQVRFRTWQNFVPEAVDYKRRSRIGLTCGTGLTRQNKWRTGDKRARRPHVRFVCGNNLTRQNNWRHYA